MHHRSAADSDQTIKQESYAQDALYLTDKRIAVADCATSIIPSTRAKAVRLTSTPTAATTSGRRSWAWYTSSRRQPLFANHSQTFMPQSSIASYIGDLPPETSNACEIGAKFDLFDGITR